ncbi:MAG TPA: ABC transporter substrate-binding protein [Verrucomicrobium sp.]|nr:ABC transporter substrate-binding protein [Verrucomicrobium sp.]
MRRRHFLTLSALGLAGFPGCRKKADPSVVRFGHFPNITHVQGLVAHHLSRQGKGWFEERTGLKVEWYTYNAGPSATEAIFAGGLDVTYIGPSPALNAYAKSGGKEIRVLAGGADGGNALVVRPAAGITQPSDFRGKKIASPQLGNTQDVQVRAWLLEQGLNITLTGGDAHVLPTQNADQLALFQKGEIDAVWTVEPWVTRLENEAGGKIFLQDTTTNVTLLVASAEMIHERPQVAKKIASAHEELTEWILAHPAETKAMVKSELTDLTGKAPADALVEKALSRTIVTKEVSRESLERMVASANKVGFLKGIPNLDDLFPKL